MRGRPGKTVTTESKDRETVGAVMNSFVHGHSKEAAANHPRSHVITW